MTRHAFALLSTLLIAGPAAAQPANRNAPAAPAPAAPAVAAGPDRTTASYGDWVVRCEPRVAGAPANMPARQCEMAQILKDQRGNTLAQIGVGRTAANRPWRVVLILPVNITVAGQIQLQPEENGAAGALTLPLKACAVRGCLAETEAGNDVLARFKNKENAGRLTFQDAAGNAVALPFSLRGFGQANDALVQGG